MNIVAENIADSRSAPNGLPPLPNTLPVNSRVGGQGGGDNEVCAKTLDQFRTPMMNDTQELLKNRFLCKQGGLLVIGQTGIGKSSLAMQLMTSWALGKPAFGIPPARRITSMLIQAENDEGDLAEMRNGVFTGMGLAEEERRLACSRIFVAQEKTRTGEAFFSETLRPLLKKHKPDLLWIDPALAYLGGESNSQQVVGAFLRNQLNPLLTEFNCGVVVIHHTNKPYNGPDRRGAVDHAYLGGGSAEWANWSRAILSLSKTKNRPDVFELRAAKRGNRLGWKAADKTTTAYNRFIAHTRKPGEIHWADVDPLSVEGLESDAGDPEDDVMKHVPRDQPIAKNALIELCGRNGLGENSTRKAIKKLVADKKLTESKKGRKGTGPEKYLACIPPPP